MKSSSILAALISATLLYSPAPNPSKQRMAALCFFTGQQVSGMNKICFYNCLGSQAAITIGALALCPINIDR